MARTLSDEEHSICVIEQDEKLAAVLNEQLDSRVLHGSGASGVVERRVADAKRVTRDTEQKRHPPAAPACTTVDLYP